MRRKNGSPGLDSSPEREALLVPRDGGPDGGEKTDRDNKSQQRAGPGLCGALTSTALAIPTLLHY